MKKKTVLSLSMLVFASVLLAGCGLTQTDETQTPLPTPVLDSGVVAEGNLVPEETLYLSFSVAGKVSEILVSEGDRVEMGQAIARIGDTEALQAQVQAADLAALEAQQTLDDLNDTAELVAAQAQMGLANARQSLVVAEQAWDAVDTDEFQQDLDDARIEMTDAKSDLNDAQETLVDYEDLDEDNPTRQAYQEDVDEAQQAYDEARWAFEDLQNQYDLAAAQLSAAQETLAEAARKVAATSNGPDEDDLALAEANLAQAESRKKAAEKALADAELVAPLAGKLVQMNLTEGTNTAPGAVAAVLVDDSGWYVETNDLTENEVVQISEGEEVTVTFDALTNKTFTGEVETISEYFQERFGDITYVVKIRLTGLDEALRWGMTAEVMFPEP